ncbi:hypothetical protein CYMTET_24091 [Cymbomonas tetramitiformis]|uniref:Uncharacterized protein n=1 Tax=Cymbomonas tetramitiformis TaxID=36881 RepID=A0AAE0FX18_9CHLO|nr:hypothetical protein CYMTET_24091 [Cymbomonas tetramitiformis]
MEALEFNEAQAQRDVSALQAGDRLTRKEAGAIAREELGFEAPVYELGVKGLDVLRKKSVLDMLKQKDIKLVVESGSDTGYQSQGNILLYTNTAIKQRKKIKGSIKMRKEIISWWHLLEFEEKGGVDRTDFAHLYTEVAAMLEVEYTSQDVARDWAEESKGKSHLGFSDFLESVFELVDLWVDSVDVHEYLIFMDNVLQHLRKTHHFGNRIEKQARSHQQTLRAKYLASSKAQMSKVLGGAQAMLAFTKPARPSVVTTGDSNSSVLSKDGNSSVLSKDGNSSVLSKDGNSSDESRSPSTSPPKEKKGKKKKKNLIEVGKGEREGGGGLLGAGAEGRRRISGVVGELEPNHGTKGGAGGSADVFDAIPEEEAPPTVGTEGSVTTKGPGPLLPSSTMSSSTSMERTSPSQPGLVLGPEQSRADGLNTRGALADRLDAPQPGERQATERSEATQSAETNPERGRSPSKSLQGINVEIPVTPWEIASHEHRDQVEAMVAAEGGDGKEAAATSAARGSGNKESAAAEEGKVQNDSSEQRVPSNGNDLEAEGTGSQAISPRAFMVGRKCSPDGEAKKRKPPKRQASTRLSEPTRARGRSVKDTLSSVSSRISHHIKSMVDNDSDHRHQGQPGDKSDADKRSRLPTRSRPSSLEIPPTSTPSTPSSPSSNSGANTPESRPATPTSPSAAPPAIAVTAALAAADTSARPSGIPIAGASSTTAHTVGEDGRRALVGKGEEGDAGVYEARHDEGIGRAPSSQDAKSRQAQPDTRTADEKAADPTAVFVRQQQFRRLNQARTRVIAKIHGTAFTSDTSTALTAKPAHQRGSYQQHERRACRRRVTFGIDVKHVLMVITHAGGLAFFDLDMKY